MIDRPQTRSHVLSRVFRRDEGGQIAVAFALLILPILGAVGAAVDYSRAITLRSEIQAAADAAVLAASVAPTGTTDAARQTRANSVFVTNLGPDNAALVSSKALTATSTGYRYAATADLNTVFARVLGKTSFELGVVSEATTSSSKSLEFVIAFDATNSMLFSPSEWATAQNVVKTFISEAFAAGPSGTVTGTLMPFSDRVRLGDARASFATGAKPTNWGGCLDSRPLPMGRAALNAWRHSDDTPDTQPFKFFTPHTVWELPGNKGSSWYTECFGPEVTGPTRNETTLKTAVSNLYVGGTGRPDEGMAWAWRLLSPKWKGKWSLAGYPGATTEAQKLAVLITDGRTEMYRYEVTTPSGSVYGWNLGSPDGFNNMELVCTDMKAQGIDLHVIALTGNTFALPHLQRCASSSDNYHFVNDIASFQSAFSKIGARASKLRLSM